jgi:hypothetical protein
MKFCLALYGNLQELSKEKQGIFSNVLNGILYFSLDRGETKVIDIIRKWLS